MLRISLDLLPQDIILFEVLTGIFTQMERLFTFFLRMYFFKLFSNFLMDGIINEIDEVVVEDIPLVLFSE